MTIRFLIALAVKRDLEIYHFDVESAFSYGDLDTTIFIEEPEGIREPEERKKQKRFLKLNKALYGSKQAGRSWNKKITEFLIEIGLLQSNIDQCVFFYP